MEQDLILEAVGISQSGLLKAIDQDVLPLFSFSHSCFGYLSRYISI